MKLKYLLNFLDGDTYLQLIDLESEQYIEGDAANTLIEYFGEVEVRDIYTSGTLYIKIHKCEKIDNE